MFPNLKDCRKYFICSGGKITPVQCPDGSLFNTASILCDLTMQRQNCATERTDAVVVMPTTPSLLVTESSVTSPTMMPYPTSETSAPTMMFHPTIQSSQTSVRLPNIVTNIYGRYVFSERNQVGVQGGKAYTTGNAWPTLKPKIVGPSTPVVTHNAGHKKSQTDILQRLPSTPVPATYNLQRSRSNPRGMISL